MHCHHTALQGVTDLHPVMPVAGVPNLWFPAHRVHCFDDSVQLLYSLGVFPGALWYRGMPFAAHSQALCLAHRAPGGIRLFPGSLHVMCYRWGGTARNRWTKELGTKRDIPPAHLGVVSTNDCIRRMHHPLLPVQAIVASLCCSLHHSKNNHGLQTVTRSVVLATSVDIDLATW